MINRIRRLLGLSYVVKSGPGCWHDWGRPVGPTGEATLSDGTPIRLAPTGCGCWGCGQIRERLPR